MGVFITITNGQFRIPRVAADGITGLCVLVGDVGATDAGGKRGTKRIVGNIKITRTRKTWDTDVAKRIRHQTGNVVVVDFESRDGRKVIGRRAHQRARPTLVRAIDAQDFTVATVAVNASPRDAGV